MSNIFLAECGSRQQAEIFSQHFNRVIWTLKDDIESQCNAEIKQDFEGNWWCSLSASGIDWTPANRQEGNYRHFQIGELQIYLTEHLKSAPAFRYGFIVELEDKDLNKLLTDSSWQISYSQLFSCSSSENPQTKLNIPTLVVYILKAGFLLSESLWQQVGTPSKFEPFIQGYVWLQPSPTVIWGGLQAPPKEVITQTTMRIVLDPQEAENYHQMGSALLRQGRLAEAIANYEQAQKLNPFSPQIHQMKAVALWYMQRLPEALDACGMALTLNPNFVEAHQTKGDILYTQGKLQEALESFETSLGLNPDDSASYYSYYRKGLILAALGKYQEALVACESALSLNPNQVEAHELRLKILESLIEINPDFHTYYYYQKGVSLGLLGRHEEASVAFENSLRAEADPNNPNNSRAYYNKGSALWNSGHWEEGLASYNMAIQLEPDYGLAHFDKGNLLHTLGRYEEALLSLNEAVRLMPYSEMAHYLKGICLDMLGYNQEALVCFDTALRLDPYFARAYQAKGITFDKLGRYEEALQSLEYSLQLDPYSPNTQNSIRIVRKHLDLGVDSF